MKRCTQCGEHEGVIDLTHIEGTDVRVDHLCAKCAAEKGIQTAAALADTPLGGLLGALGVDPGATSLDQRIDLTGDITCPRCGASVQDFRETGRLGCPDCYTAFADPLRELLRRLHGSAHHTGKPYQAPVGLQSQDMSSLESADGLRERLQRAIASEEFELAAKLRDQLKEHE